MQVHICIAIEYIYGNKWNMLLVNSAFNAWQRLRSRKVIAQKKRQIRLNTTGTLALEAYVPVTARRRNT